MKMINLIITISTYLVAILVVGSSSAGAINGHDDYERPVERSLQDLEQRWRIEEPAFNYSSLQFSLSWKVSDFIEDRFMDYKVYDGFDCKEGSNDITEESNNVQNGTVYLLTPGIIPSALTPHNPTVTSGSGERNVHLRFSIQSENIAKSPIYKEDLSQSQVSAEVRFCVRYSLWNDHPLIDGAVEVNFQETLIYFQVDLTDGFEIGEITVEDKETSEVTANIACEVIGYECYHENNTAITDPGYLRNQGAETRICVTTTEESKANGLYLNRINWFYFYRVNPEGIVRQNAIIYDSISAPSGLTEYYCQPGEDPCGFNTVLNANFYDRAGVGIVLGEGEATCQYGGLKGPDGQPVVEIGVEEDTSSGGGGGGDEETPVPSMVPTSASIPGTGGGTPAPQSAPSPGYPEAGSYPTPAPCTDPVCLNCGTEAQIYYESNDEIPFPPGAIVIDDQAEDGTAVTFTVTQLWKADDSISWIAILYPDHTEGNNVCPKVEEVAYRESFTHTATCFNSAASSVQVYIEIYVHDGSFGKKSDAYVPEDCQPSQDVGRKVAYEIFIPCQPCSRRLSQNMILSAPFASLSENYHGLNNDHDNKHIPSLLNMGVYDTNVAEKVPTKKPVDDGHAAKSMIARQRKRKLQQDFAPSPFELEFAVLTREEKSLAPDSIRMGLAAMVALLAGTFLLMV